MKKKLIVLCLLIILMVVLSGYYAYSTFFAKQSNTILNELEYEEEINLGDCNANCSASCKYAGNGTSEYNYCYTGCMSGCKDSCSEGYYLRNNKCVQCPAGTFSEGGTSTSCTKCNSGMYSAKGSGKCTACMGLTDGVTCYSTKVCSGITSGSSCLKITNKSCTWDYSSNKCLSETNDIAECPPGQYSKDGECADCPAGTYSAGGKIINCLTCMGTVSSDRTSCSVCPEQSYKPAGKSECEPCSSGVVYGSSGTGQTCCVYNINGFPGKASPTSSGKVTVSVSDPKCPAFSYVVENFKPGTSNTIASSFGAVREGSVEYSGLMPCSTFKITLTANGKVVASGSADVSSNWSQTKVRQTFDENTYIPFKPEAADSWGTSYRDASDCDYAIPGKKTCSVYIRTCGGGGGPALYNYCCVNNGTIGLSTEAKPYESVPEKTCPTNWTLLENVKKEDCKIETVEKGSCNINDIPSSKQTGAANSCESTVSIKVDEGKQCTNTTENEKTSFYEISCAKTVKTGFDYGNDGKTDTIRTLYKGEGFAFGINVETSINCKYTFYDETWKSAYNKAKNKIQKIDSNLVQYVEKNQTEEWKTYINNNILNKNGVTDASKLYDLWDTIENLREAVKTYNEYKPSSNYKENGEITLTVNEKGKSVATKHKLTQIVKEEGTYKSSEISTKKLNVPLLSDPKSYMLSSNTPRKVLLIPKKVCIDKKGNFNTIEGTECPKNTIDGGNKIYTDMATDVTNGNTSYPISITIGGLGSNDSSVTNDKCNLKIIESKYIYRPIDVENPFISNSWQKGKNWVNEIFDFTKVINKNTWQDNSKRKVISLTAKDIAKLKESNAKAWKDTNSPYLGLCISQEETLQDEITKKLCSIIK